MFRLYLTQLNCYYILVPLKIPNLKSKVVRVVAALVNLEGNVPVCVAARNPEMAIMFKSRFLVVL